MSTSIAWDELTWTELKDLVSKYRVIAILPVGSVEQHGPHLPLGTDYLIAMQLGKELINYFNSKYASTSLRLVLLPPIIYGYSIMWASYPGTITISVDTLRMLLKDIINSVIRSGVKDLLVLNSHAGNSDILKVALREIAEAHNDVTLCLVTIWEVIGDVINDVLSTKFFHADEAETSVALALGLRVKRAERGEDIFRYYNDFWHSLDLTKRPKIYVFRRESGTVTRLGAYGRPDLGDRDKGRILIKAIIERLCDFILSFFSQ